MAIGFSLRLFILLLLLHSTAAVVSCLADVPQAASLLLVLAILASLSYYLARDVFLVMRESWRVISLDQDTITVVTREGLKCSGKIESGTVVSSFLVVLRVKLDDRFFPLFRVIFPDALGSDQFREFCVRIRFSA